MSSRIAFNGKHILQFELTLMKRKEIATSNENSHDVHFKSSSVHAYAHLKGGHSLLFPKPSPITMLPQTHYYKTSIPFSNACVPIGEKFQVILQNLLNMVFTIHLCHLHPHETFQWQSYNLAGQR